ncbi:FadR/GntR family transcriptional regulator [Microbacterium terrisoli]|jgi:DNA-binding FadR family transcriptional regulator|uniref:FadR/GntR family transcriptional regulator n=1 Tax=Microbacterium terrisoli TaxID=3242192 RepID=UPI002805D4B5|nr:FCD domain-containing protein [Microbacterium protaetiae]
MRAGSSSGGDLHSRVVEDIGQRIINGELAVGDTIFAEQVCERLNISRPVVREGLRTLSSLGLIQSRPQRGTRVLPRSNWDFLSPYIIRWRGQSPDRLTQMRELLELRLGIEHAAAYFAATRRTDAAAAAMKDAAARMKTALDAHDTFAYFRADQEVHRLMLEGSENAVLAQFAETVTALLRIRGETNPLVYSPQGLARASLHRHIALADALDARDPERAAELAREIIIETLKEVDAVTPPPASPPV